MTGFWGNILALRRHGINTLFNPDWTEKYTRLTETPMKMTAALWFPTARRDGLTIKHGHEKDVIG